MRAALRCGFPVRKLYIDREGTIVIEAGEPPKTADPEVELDEWKDGA